jgi:hypothetical protein
MDNNDLNRRDFQRLAVAALGGLVAGAGLAHADDKKDKDKDDKKEPKPKDEKKNPLLQEPHVCRGLNTCKGLGKGLKNDCAGTSACATAKAHTCGGENDCRGLGGCGEMPGENACKTKGKCHVPLEDKAWEKARKRFEEVMKKEGKKFGEAPKKSKE